MGTLAVVEAVKRSGANRDTGFAGPDHGAGRMNKRSIATVSLSGALDEKLRAIAAAGFDAVEIFENDLLSFGGSPRDVGTALPRSRSCDLRVPAVSRFRGHAGAAARAQFRPRRAQVRPDAGTADRSAADLQQRLAGLARRHRSRRRRFPRARRTAPPRAACASAIEALAWGRHVNDYRDAWEIVRRADHKSIGIILDSFHALAPAFPVTADPRRSRPTRSSWCSWPMRRSSNSTSCPGAGISAASRARAICRWRDFMEAVAATGYAGPLSLEIFNDQFRAGSAVAHRDRRAAFADPAGGSACPERGRRLGSEPLPPKAHEPRRRLHRIRRQRDQGQRARRAVRPARLSQDRLASQQGRWSAGRRAISNS